MAVVDRAPGLTPVVLERAGEPFDTTKEPGHGLGLGLFLARIFVERMGGSLTLESSAGTTAVLELPCRVRAADGT
jgi:two-component system sensor histidine kinase RegB